MRPIAKVFTILYLLQCFNLLASEVLKISPSGRYLVVSPDAEPAFKVGDYACIVEEQKEVACGYVSLASARGAVLYLDHKNPLVEVGSTVDHAVLDKPNHSFSEVREGADLEESVPFYSLLFGHGPQLQAADIVTTRSNNVWAEMNFTNPSVILEKTLDTNWTWGIQLSLNQFSSLNMNVQKPVSGTLVGLLANFNYYPTEIFQGLWIRTGVGYYAGKLTYKTSADNPGVLSALSTVGYRWVKHNFNYGISGGLQYFNVIQTQIFPYNVNLITPVLALNLGWVF